MNIIDGKKESANIREQLKKQILHELPNKKSPPGLAVVLVGEDPASHVYVRNKEKDCELVGIRSITHRLPAETLEKTVLELVANLNQDPKVNGIIVQLPLPKHIDTNLVMLSINPEKDADGFHPINLGRLLSGNNPTSLPCTPAGIMHLIKSTGIQISGKLAVVVGRSTIVGKPVSLLLQQENATVTMCHSRTIDLPCFCRMADILVVAIGRSKMVKTDYIKPGAVVVDVGMCTDENGKLCGDVDYETVKDICSWITPVPGGVGPMTRAMLLSNTVSSWIKVNDKY